MGLLHRDGKSSHNGKNVPNRKVKIIRKGNCFRIENFATFLFGKASWFGNSSHFGKFSTFLFGKCFPLFHSCLLPIGINRINDSHFDWYNFFMHNFFPAEVRFQCIFPMGLFVFLTCSVNFSFHYYSLTQKLTWFEWWGNTCQSCRLQKPGWGL